MKRRVVALLLVTIMAMSGCVKETKGDSGAVADTGQVQNEISEQSEAGASVDSVEDDGTQSTDEGTDKNDVSFLTNPAVTTGGKPWINSNLKENITDNMDVSLKDDFHLAVNYDWLKETELSDASMDYNTFDEANSQIQDNALAALLDADLQGHDAELVRSFAKAMLDWDARNAKGIDPMLDIIEEIRGVKTLDELSDLICDPERNYQVPRFVSISNEVNTRDTGKYIVALSWETFLFDSFTEYTNRSAAGERKYNALKTLVGKMLTRAGYSETEAAQMLDTALDVETKMANRVAANGNSLPGPKPLDQVCRMINSFPLERYIREMGYGDSKKYQEMDFFYLGNVDALYKEENLSNLKDYMIVKYVVNVCSQLDREACDAYSEYYNTIYGTEGDQCGEDSLLFTVENMLSEPLTKMYLEKYDETQLKERITNLIKDVTDEYRKMLQEEDWLSDEMKEKAIEKLDNMIVNAIYPDEWKDYSSLELNGLSYWDSIKAIKEFKRQENLALTNGMVNRTEWLSNTLEPNAYYYPQYNSINILLGIMGGSLWYDGIPDEELYAGVGTVIGHEISHAFDIYGAEFDKDGKKANWWTLTDKNMFQEKAIRTWDYLNTIKVWEGGIVDGTRVLGETMADVTGMEVILRLAEHKENFDYDKFFRSYAGLWKTVNRYEYEYNRFAWDSHPLNYLRTNIVLQQFDKFYETYDIQEGDGMYLAPEDRVLVW